MYGLETLYSGAEGQRPFINKLQNNRTLLSQYFKSVKFCYVCGENHKARTRHSQKVVREVIVRLKNRNSHSMISVLDFAYIYIK